MSEVSKRTRRGDTLIEVVIALAVFSLVSVVTVLLMNDNVSVIQGVLELDMARNEIDAQAEAIRFIHNSYLSERELKDSERVYQNLWLQLSRGTTAIAGTMGHSGEGLANNPARVSAYPAVSCADYYDETKVNNGSDPNDVHSLFDDRAFVINTRDIDPYSIDTTIIRSAPVGAAVRTDMFVPTPLYPRILFATEPTAASAGDSDELLENSDADNDGIMENDYDRVARVEGIWVIAARDATEVSNMMGDTFTEDDSILEGSIPEYYDFHIRTCWNAPGRVMPTAISTIIRLYNPEYTEDTR